MISTGAPFHLQSHLDYRTTSSQFTQALRLEDDRPHFFAMSIRYKSKTEKVFSSINIPESYISVLELKNRLIKKEKIDMGRDFKFILTDESGEHGKRERPLGLSIRVRR